MMSRRLAELLRHAFSPEHRTKTLLATAASSSAYAFARGAGQERLHTWTETRPRYMPPLWLDRLRMYNIAHSLPESQTGETSLHGRVQLIAPAGLDESIAAQLAATLNRLVAAAEEHSEAISYGQHLKSHTWNLVVRRTPSAEASTLDGTIFLSAGMVGMLLHESSAWQASLAGIMAHELGHNVARHVLENQLDFLRFRWTLMFRLPLHFLKAAVAARGLPAADWVDQWHDEEVASLCRQREHEADELAVSILARAGFPPDSLARALPLLEPSPASAQPSPSWAGRLRAALGGWAAAAGLEQAEAGAGAGDAHVEPGACSAGAGAAGAQQGSEEKGLAKPASRGSGGPDTHPPMEARVARMEHLAREPAVQQLYHRHSWLTRLRLSWQ